MFERVWPIVATLWRTVDERLRELSAGLQRMLRMLRLARALLWIGVADLLGTAALALATVLGWVSLDWFLIAYAVSTLFLMIPLVALALLVSLPLRLRRIVSLIDQGYPENFREIALRVLARKLHDESIATEELLWDTAVNEARKVARRMQAQDEPEPAPAPGAPPPV